MKKKRARSKKPLASFTKAMNRNTKGLGRGLRRFGSR